MIDVLIIGSGPAGISASLYAARSGMNTKVISTGNSSLFKAHMIENYYGTGNALSGSELYENGIRQAKSLGVEIINAQVLGLNYEKALTAITDTGEYEAKTIIIATGSARNTPPIKGLKEFEGLGVSYCAVCDGFFHRGKDVAVLGKGQYALHEASELSPVAGSVSILTDGKEAEFEIPSNMPNVKLNKNKIKEFAGGDTLNAVIFEDQSTLSVSGVFVAAGTAGSVDLARKLGAVTDGNKIAVNADMVTNIPGLYAAGDCTPGMLQVAKAVYQGAVAASSATKYIRAMN